MAHWAEQYVGLPYSEYDCAELCVKVQKDIFGRDINLPTDRANSVHGISNQIHTLQDEFATRIEVPNEGDAVLMVGRGRINHIGTLCLISGQRFVLHAVRSAKQTVLHSVSALESVGLAVEGYYKWN